MGFYRKDGDLPISSNLVEATPINTSTQPNLLPTQSQNTKQIQFPDTTFQNILSYAMINIIGDEKAIKNGIILKNVKLRVLILLYISPVVIQK